MYDSFLTSNIVFVWLNPIYPHGLVAVTECSSIVHGFSSFPGFGLATNFAKLIDALIAYS